MLLLGQGIDLPTFIAFIVVAFFAFAYHELGHAVVADYLGDMTPRMNGRMTLNPIPHVSLMGLVMLILIGFGWAVTPINPNALRGNPRTSHVYVALAGPAMNLLMAILFAIPLRLMVMGVIDTSAWITGGDLDNWVQLLFTLLRLGVWLKSILNCL